VILTFILAGLSVSGVMFMLTFLNAMMRERRKDRARGIDEHPKNGLAIVTPPRYQGRDRAA
jgi:hypothetical protein